jgi:hypothetical protein
MENYKRTGSQPVYYDYAQNRYYTQQPLDTNNAFANILKFSSSGNPKTYLDSSPFQNKNQSMIGNMTQNRLPYQYNAPTAAQMFGGMQAPMQTPFSGMFGGMSAPSFNMGGMPAMGQGQGLFGAGRFLNGGLLNSTSTTGT